jgi:hypothetical protein
MKTSRADVGGDDNRIPDVAIIALWAFVGVLMEHMSDEAIKRMLRPEILARVIEELRK